MCIGQIQGQLDIIFISGPMIWSRCLEVFLSICARIQLWLPTFGVQHKMIFDCLKVVSVCLSRRTLEASGVCRTRSGRNLFAFLLILFVCFFLLFLDLPQAYSCVPWRSHTVAESSHQHVRRGLIPPWCTNSGHNSGLTKTSKTEIISTGLCTLRLQDNSLLNTVAGATHKLRTTFVG